MILKRLVLNNFRQFKGRTVIDFSPIDGKHVTFVYASNGVGKTTLLSSIVWCLYGGDELEYVDQKSIFLNKSLFQNLPNNGELNVEATLIFEDREKQYTVKRIIVIQSSNGKQRISKQDLEVQINNETQHDPQERINSVLSPAMKEYFFFKGEGVQKFADESNYKKVQDGIKNIMKIDTREKALAYIESARSKFTKDLNDIKKEQGNIETLPEEKKEELIETQKNIKIDIEKCNQDIEIFDDIIQKIEINLLDIKEIKNLSVERESLLKEIEEHKSRYSELQSQQKEKIVQEAYLALSDDVFKTSKHIIDEKRETGILPVGIRKKFVEELINSHTCICGTTFNNGDEHHAKLLKIIDSVSDESVIEDALNELSYFIEAKKDITSKYSSEYKILSDELNSIKETLNALEQKFSALEDNIENELPQNEENLISRKKQTQHDRDDRIKKRERFFIQLEEIEIQLKEIETLIGKYETQNEAINLVRDRIAFCSEAVDVLTEENTRIIEQIKHDLSNRLNTKFQLILHAQKNAKIDDQFRLIITEGIDEENVSAKSDGEGQLISLLFISTLIDMARNREQKRNSGDIDPGAGIYPIVIDSPYGQFDTVYKQYISEVVRDMAPQVIILLNQEQWNDGKDLYRIFENDIAHQYVLIAHRPKLSHAFSKINKINYNNKSIDMEILDEDEYTEIKNMKEVE
jgi:DNA sulfur modification protein DndD